MAALYIPGMRVEIRAAEWRIQPVDRCADGGYLLHCAGLSELVRGRSARFMIRLEEQMGNAPCVLDPVTSELVVNRPQRFGAIRTSPNETLPDVHGNYTVFDRKNRYHAPFVKPERERDYRLVWEVLA